MSSSGLPTTIVLVGKFTQNILPALFGFSKIPALVEFVNFNPLSSATTVCVSGSYDKQRDFELLGQEMASHEKGPSNRWGSFLEKIMTPQQQAFILCIHIISINHRENHDPQQQTHHIKKAKSRPLVTGSSISPCLQASLNLSPRC